jgi:integral membrane protein
VTQEPGSASGSTSTSPGGGERAVRSPRKLAGALLRYRVMAFVTGGFLLLLCVELVLKYGVNGGEPVLGAWIAIVHGWIYVVYLVTVVDLWSSLRWRLGRLLALVAAGVVPLLSFYAERRTTEDVRALMVQRGEIAPAQAR